MNFLEKINTDMNIIMSSCKRIFARPWDEGDCIYFCKLIIDDIVKNSRSSEELEHIMGDFGMTIIMMLTHLDEKEGNDDPF